VRLAAIAGIGVASAAAEIRSYELSETGESPLSLLTGVHWNFTIR